MFKNLKYALTVAVVVASCLTIKADLARLTSPDNNIEVIFTNSEGSMKYQVRVGNTLLLYPSELGLVASNWKYRTGGELSVSRTSVDKEWTQPWGENTQCRENYNEMAIELPGGELTIRFRVFNDGLGFRYETNAPVDTLVITDELSSFWFAPAGESWAIPASFETYELEYRHLPIKDVTDANTPFTFRCEGDIFGSIHEAALYDYPEMVLRSNDLPGRLKADLAPLPNGVKAYVPGRFTTPWRTIQLGKSATDLINSDLILNLNEPSKIEDTSWIKPQKYVGIWWGMHLGTQTWTMGPRHGATTENAIKYIDFAKANNLQGVLFEGWNEGWENWGGNQHFDYLKAYADFDIDSIADYARSNGIELWMHDETGGNIPEFEAVLDSAFAYYASLGVHTVKTGYAGGFKGGYFHHSQYGVRHYQRVVETAAKYQIMIDAHEPIKETGIRRTWPNMMTREGARGMEWNAWSDGNSADYLCTLPFVRLLSGPMDYTPGIFDIYYKRAKADPGRIEWNGPNGHCYIKTTLARQIANWVIIYSPLQMAADQIENYEGQEAFKFFRDFNADCDWSKALQGEIGKYIVVARRAGDRYFVGAGTNSEARTLSLPLDFLKSDCTYTAEIYADVEGAPDKVNITRRTVTSSDTLEIVMQPTGGQAITFIPRQ
ncbi:MAG: glycoside hydrolase family 97 protein [Bacteroides sp.]|nr:glycoside hydrolase family 97 protein [Bacteroides sp.]MCM1413381.1 glycoside hydrolase family 97 protein [Bacteroides sp.]MCM1471933.1 glycoside hydrolase family 97 protein [Bacteroides sp.]